MREKLFNMLVCKIWNWVLSYWTSFVFLHHLSNNFLLLVIINLCLYKLNLHSIRCYGVIKIFIITSPIRLHVKWRKVCFGKCFSCFQCFSGNECILCFVYFIYYFIMSFSDCRTVIRQTPPDRHFRDQTIPWQNISPIGLPRPVISPPDTFRIIIIFCIFSLSCLFAKSRLI